MFVCPLQDGVDNHSVRLQHQSLNRWACRVLCCQHKGQVGHLLIVLKIEFMKTMKSRGPKMEPCSTPEVTEQEGEEAPPRTTL